jgi:hypothetical protein
MPRPRLSKEEKELRKKAAQIKWQHKVGIRRQGSPPPIVLTHRPVTRSQSVEMQPAIRARSTLKPASTQALPTSVLPLLRASLEAAAEPELEPVEQEEPEEEQVSIGSEDPFQPLFGDDTPPFNSAIASTRYASLLIPELPRDEGLSSSYPL